MTGSAELRRRAAVLYRESRTTPDPALARLLMLRSLRMTAAASAAETHDVAANRAELTERFVRLGDRDAA